MKFLIDKNVFLKHLEEIYKCIDTSNIYIHLRNIYINVLDNMIIAKGSNGIFSIESKIEENRINLIKETGKFLVPANLLLNTVRKCAGEIEFETKDNILFIKNGIDNYEINLSNVDDFPSIDFTLYGNKIRINASKLKKAIDNVIFAAAQNNEDIILIGVNFKYESGKLYIRATDSFRMAQDIIEIEDDRNISFDITVNSKNLKNLIPSNIDDDVIVYTNEQKINVIYQMTNYQSKIIEAPYKNVDHIFNLKYDKKIIIDKSIFNNALNKAIVYSSSDSSYNKIHLSISKEEMELSVNANEIGRTKVLIPNSDFIYEGDNKNIIILNYKYLKEAISVFNDKINISFIDSKRPILIEEENSLVKQIISPMNS